MTLRLLWSVQICEHWKLYWNNTWEEITKKNSFYEWMSPIFRRENYVGNNPNAKKDTFSLIEQGVSVLPPMLEVSNDRSSCSFWRGHFWALGAPLTSGGPQGAALGPISFLLDMSIFACNLLVFVADKKSVNINKLQVNITSRNFALFCKKCLSVSLWSYICMIWLRRHGKI